MLRLGGLLLGIVIGFVAAGLLGAHAYRGGHTGLVLASCGPAVEITGNPRFYMAQCK